MAHYIDKDALVAEIERRKNEAEYNCGGFKSHAEHVCDFYQVAKYEEFEEIINTLEMKEVDLEREIDGELKTRWMGEYLNTEKFYESAKHFFELGIKAQKGE